MNKPFPYIRIPDSSRRANYRLAHIAVAEFVLGHALPKGAQVHHVNGDKTDNRTCNLVICQDAAYHSLLHRRERALLACGNANAERCGYCGGYNDQDDMSIVGHARRKVYHRRCQNAYSKYMKYGTPLPWRAND